MGKRDELKKLRESAKNKISIQEENEKNNPLDAYLPSEEQAGEQEQEVELEQEIEQEKEMDQEQEVEQAQEMDQEDVATQLENIDNVQRESRSLRSLITVEKKEAKSQRVNLLLKPSIHKESQKICREMGISLNELIGQLLEAFIDDSKAK